MTINRRLMARLLLSGFVLMLCLSSVLLIHEAGHECRGHECPVCENLARMAALLESFVLLGICAAAVRMGRAALRSGGREEPGCGAAAFTPVEGKVRLNN